jgi:hypothetical protein
MTPNLDSPPLSDLFAPLTATERKRLRRFVRKANELAGSRFAQTRPELTVKMLPGQTEAGGQAWEVRPSGADQEAVKAVDGDFRQLWTDSNPTSAASVLSILKNAAKRRGSKASREVIKELRKFGRRLEERGRTDPRGKMLVEVEFGVSREMEPREIINLWLKGEYLHDDLDKADELGLDEESAMSALTQHSLQSAISDYISYWSVLANLVAKVLGEPALEEAA